MPPRAPSGGAIACPYCGFRAGFHASQCEALSTDDTEWRDARAKSAWDGLQGDLTKLRAMVEAADPKARESIELLATHISRRIVTVSMETYLRGRKRKHGKA